jgi:hypothetical protein
MSESWLTRRACDVAVKQLYGLGKREETMLFARSLSFAIEAVAREFAERALQHALYGKLLNEPYGDAPITTAIAEADKP